MTTVSSSLGPAQSTSQPVSTASTNACAGQEGVGRRLVDGQSTSGVALEAERQGESHFLRDLLGGAERRPLPRGPALD